MTLRKIGRYEILSELGRGGMSTVYLAHDPRFERDVAVKLLPREFLHDPTFIARFRREAKTIASLEHAAIVPVYDFGEEEGQPYLVMRYMIGGSLIKKLDQGPLSLEEISNITSRLATALDEAHERGMIHRDIKPGNILFDHHGDAFLTDFGIVKLTQETTTYTGGGIIGTPAYMSPEQARGDRELDLRSDVYAVGVIVFEMLSGKPPYEADTPLGVAIKHITEPIPNILDTRPDLQPNFATLIERVLCKDREGRYASAGEFAAELEKTITQEGEAVTPEAVATFEEQTVVPEEIITEEEEGPPPEPPITPELISEPEIESTVIEPEVVEPEIREPEIPAAEIPVVESLLGPTPVFRNRGFKMPVWGWAAGGMIIIAIVVIGLLTSGNGLFTTQPISTPLPTPRPTLPAAAPALPAEPTPMPTKTLPPVEGPDPSYRIGAFYYPWYSNPENHERWFHWEEPDYDPPIDISSDYYPLLGAYSSFDPQVVAQHFAWFRQAGIGVVITSWWGRGSIEDEALPLLLEMAERYKLKVAFHLEPYDGRSPGQLVDDIQYLYARYGSNPSFFRTNAQSRWSPDDRPKGLFFVFNITQTLPEEEPIEPEHWVDAIEAIHNLPDGGLVIAQTVEPNWIDRAHFDGIYNYVTQGHIPGESFNWARSIPLHAWYVPSVMPGFSAQRIGIPSDNIPRLDGATYEEQWRTALGVSVEPQMVTITSFNEWHEGTQIEPAITGMTNNRDYTYADYGDLGPGGYLGLTREFVNQFLDTEWPKTYRAQIHITTTSDWTIYKIVNGASWIRPSKVLASEEAIYAGMDYDLFRLEQPVERAEEGGMVELVIDILFTNMDPDGTLTLRIERGGLGWTEVELFNYIGEEPLLVETFRWDEVLAVGRNFTTFNIPASEISARIP